ncbi:16S rRNA (cytosine(967)-C(5))-methyltransferase RsmB [Pelotalea chapellei]|uniref:16S rRNA (cytosine(967)-C(5))-methyltransferase n=1 Tax=Pelotalea chapellei TaxID=44671 RepID=A0ABS5UCA9_9BACT|nr:16S rRNA (cytosine(967)-C(5))-methyltransferase RsmB [Pelotalea chapellei]MBT1073296.1 16S rRNA (cytosine(967)-C(5))-methyltransferase RsmB [Pelotalea chapellei]
MSTQNPTLSNPRQAACVVLRSIQKEGCYADQLMDRELSEGRLSGPDRGLFAELVFGVLRRQGTLDHIIAQLLNQSLGKLEPIVLVLLRLGLYQLVYLDRIPESAAVNETVNLAKQSVPRASGLVNAVLRNYLRRKNNITFPDPLTSPVASIAARHSQPLWLVNQWLDQLGLAETEQLAEASSLQPPLTLRTNTLLTSREELLQRFTDNGISAVPCHYSPQGIVVEGRHHIPGLPGFREGLFAVQDEASQVAALLLGVQPGERVLDSCAAPGGKATHLAQLMDNRGELLAMDISRNKLPLIQESAQRLGIRIISTRSADLLQSAAMPAHAFDRVLLDAPCSGLGVIRRNPEAKWRLTPADFTRLATTQRAMLKNAFRLLKPGGTLVYSTCSTTLEENETVVRDFVSRQNDCVLEDLNTIFPHWHDLFTSEGMLRTWPHRHGMDGFFAARLKKR